MEEEKTKERKEEDVAHDHPARDDPRRGAAVHALVDHPDFKTIRPRSKIQILSCVETA